MRKLFYRIAILANLSVGPFLAAASAQVAPVSTQRRPMLVVTVGDGGVSIKADRAPLEQLLQAIGQKSGVQIAAPDLGDKTISDEFDNLTLEKALGRLLEEWNSAYYYSWRPEGAAKQPVLTLSQVRVFDRNGREKSSLGTVIALECAEPRVTGKRPAPHDDEAEAETALWSQRLRESRDLKSGEQAALRLGRLATPQSIDLLSRVLAEDQDISVRLAAAEGLGKSWSVDAVGPLAHALLHDEDSTVRVTAARALGQTWSEEAVEPLLTALLNDRDPVVREQSARALGHTAGDEAVDGLTQALKQDRRWYVREAAARALGSVGGLEAGAALALAAAYDREPWIRETATLTALNMEPADRVSPALVRLPIGAGCAGWSRQD